MRALLVVLMVSLTMTEPSGADDDIDITTKYLMKGCAGRTNVEPCMIYFTGLELGAGAGRILVARELVKLGRQISARNPYASPEVQAEFAAAVSKSLVDTIAYMDGCQPDEMHQYGKLGAQYPLAVLI